MKVKATRIGFYEHIRRREGDVFSIPDKPRRKLTEKDSQRREFESVKEKVEEKDDKGKVVSTHYTVPAAFGTWMEPVGQREPEKTSTAQQALNKAQDELKAGKGIATGDAEVI